MNWLDQLEGWLLVPHELLHVAAYRLIGKRCRYTPGNPYVRRAERVTRNERLFVLLTPVVVTGAVSGSLAMWWAASAFVLAAADPFYPLRMPVWHLTLLLAFIASFVYTAAGWSDVLTSFYLLRDPKQMTYEPPDKPYER